MNNIIEACASIVECCIFIRICNGFLGFKSEKKKWLKTLFVFVPLALVDVFLSQLEGFENISIFMLLLILLVYSFVFLKGKKWEKVLVSVIPTVTALPINLIVMSAFSLLVGNDRAEIMPGGTMRIPVLFFTKAIFFFACEIVIKLRKKQYQSLTGFQWTIQLSCFLISFLMATLLWNISRQQPETSPLFLIIFICIGILNILLYVIMNKMQRDNITREEYNLLKANIISQEKLAVEVRERYSEVKTLKHDMKHYLTTAAGMISDKKPFEAKAYIERIIEEKINSSNVGVNTGSAVIDAVINGKITLCNSKGIKMKCSIDTQFESTYDIDISILLSNLLDNAIIGCDPDNPYIELVVSHKKSLTFITVKNSISSSILKNNPELKTDKSNKNEHGYGIRSIKDIAKKYDGSVEFKEENGNFIAEIWLKMEI
ncbi:MAG: GHKL domain-containing protein [Butyrivibrio sp.]|nr:GHKL domain-containing protein [Butyrivibrio sp.]